VFQGEGVTEEKWQRQNERDWQSGVFARAETLCPTRQEGGLTAFDREVAKGPKGQRLH
jgi:hypothetical protein